MKARQILSHPSWYLWFIPGLAAYLAQRILSAYPELVEQLHSRNLFRWLSVPIASLTSLLPFSLTEVLLILGMPLMLAALVIWIVFLCRRPARLAKAGRLLRRLAWTVSWLFLAFMLLHGLNYARLPVSASFDLPVHDRSASELETTAAWLADQSNQLRAACEEDDLNVFQLRLGVNATLDTASDAYGAAAGLYPLMAGPAIRPKGVLLSHFWSYTGITGVYFPYLVESNVNIDVPEYQIPATALHEIAHTRGFAREDEAGFIAFLAGIADSNPDFAYSVIVDAAVRCLDSLYSADKDAWQRVVDSLDAAVWRDFAASNVYWQQFAGPVQETSNQINNAFLQANLQDDGVKSYGRMIDLVLAWYQIRQSEGDLGTSVAALTGTGN